MKVHDIEHLIVVFFICLGVYKLVMVLLTLLLFGVTGALPSL